MRRALAAVLAALGLSAAAPQDAPDAPPPPPAPQSILWSRTWEGALREAEIRNVPIFILVSIGEG